MSNLPPPDDVSRSSGPARAPRPWARGAAALGCALAALAGLSTSCDRNSGDDGALEKSLERRAENRPARASLSLGAIHHATGRSRSDRPYRADLEGGGTVEVREIYIVVAAIELHACVPDRDDYEAPEGPLLNDAFDLLVPEARAHVASSSNRFGTPFVEDLAGPHDRAQIVGELAPPLAAYCRIAAVVAPADSDVVNSTGVSTEAITGSSVLVRGRRRPGPDADWTPVEWTTDRAEVFEFPARDPQSGQSPLVVDSPDDDVMLLIDKRVGPETVAAAAGADEPAAALLREVGSSMQIHVY